MFSQNQYLLLIIRSQMLDSAIPHNLRQDFNLKIWINCFLGVLLQKS